MDPIVPYIHYDGTAADALAFYEKALDGKILYKSTFGESPMPVPEEYKNKLMHGSLQAGKLHIMVSDCPPEFKIQMGNNVSLSLSFDSKDEQIKVFNALAEGGTVKMALQDTFWGAYFGMLTDKFGIHWMLSTEMPKNK
jgi:PhnB protein